MGDQPLWRRAATHTLHASLVLKAELEELLHSETGLLLADNEALLNLAAGPLRMSDIARRLILSRGGTTKVIDRLEELGYVVRSPDPDDRRATVVDITAEGREIMASARTVIDAGLEEAWARFLTDEEAETLISVMDRVVARHHEQVHP
jgi:DNA-binding MarR family transcriptional regulator